MNDPPERYEELLFKPLEKTSPQPGLLEALAVTYDGRYFRYGSYRYDRWEDAVAYAQLKGRNGGRHPFL